MHYAVMSIIHNLVYIIDREFEFYEFFSFLKFNEFYEFFRLKNIRKKFVILQIIDV